jgi:hypothetical protein
MAQSRKPHTTVSIGNSAERRIAEAAKTARLRALRLAEEAEDREAIARSARATPARPPRSPRAASCVRRDETAGWPRMPGEGLQRSTPLKVRRRL